MHLYLRSVPRSLYLVIDSQDERLGRPSKALVFRAGDGLTKVIVEFIPRDQVDIHNLVKLGSSRNIMGCLGLISIENDTFLAVVTTAAEIGNTRPSAIQAENVARIHEVGFYSLSSCTWDELPAVDDSFGSPDTTEPTPRDSYTQSAPVFEHPCLPLTKILSSGSFYYAVDSEWDISSRLAIRLSRDRDPTSFKENLCHDEKFVWNEFILRSLLDFRERLDVNEQRDFDRCNFLILAIQGYVGVFSMALPAPPTNGQPTVATLSLISRLGWKRAGTRFNTRGIDDDGNTANFVETETIFSTDQHCVSYVQIRGSVPLFWEQQGFQTFGQRIQITRPQASQPAFERHLFNLMEEYGSIHAINLLGQKENEASLTTAYARHLQIARAVLGDELGITHFDFHNAVRIGGHDSVIRDIRTTESIGDHVDRFWFTMCDAASDEIITDQKGVFRTNCLDCLDRTNFVQDILSRLSLEQYLLLVRREWILSNALWTYHRELWAENGDALSRIYAGTGALNTSFTRSGKRTLAGVLSDATKSVSRAYINNFQDKAKQIAIDTFLGNLSNQLQVTIYDPAHDYVRATLEKRSTEYSSKKQCNIFVGTWNLNGRTPTESLLPWLIPRESVKEPDIFAIGFQEIVPLTAQQIVQTDPEKRRVWENKILETLERRPKKRHDYVLLRSEQLVGTVLMILVKSELAAMIRNVEGTSRKTGLRGISGNKGAVGIRMDYHDTSFCFITAHFAAGHANVEERNADYHTINSGMHFQKGKTIESHENVIWLADTNYRVDLDNTTVRSLAEHDDFPPLLQSDQLRNVMQSGSAFAGYEEGPLLFRPTYRYDVGTDSYDTSEKMRIPAWTDRILHRGPTLDLSVYSRAELVGSDHKPVFAIYRVEVSIVDAVKKAALSRLILDNVMSTEPGELLDEKLADVVLPAGLGDLPPPSTDDSAWWVTPDCPEGVIPLVVLQKLDMDSRSNPFESPVSTPVSSTSSPSLSDEELYTHALTLQAPIAPVQAPSRRPAPPPPRPANNMRNEQMRNEQANKS